MKIPEWANWAARDDNGAIWLFEEEPKYDVGPGIWAAHGGRVLKDDDYVFRNDVALERISSDPKTGAGKPQLAHLPWQALTPLARVMDLGATKYGRYSYMNSFASSPQEATMKYLDAGLRHIAEVIADPFAIDPESGELHATHALANMSIVVAGLTSAAAVHKKNS